MEKPIIMPRPNPKQRLALLDQHRYIAYGGARGGGKSWFVRWKAILLCACYPGIRVLITRRTFRELLNNHILPLRQILGCHADYSGQDKLLKLQNGSTIWFNYCDGDSDLLQYQGAEYDVWFADEAGQMESAWLLAIDACVRGVNSFPKRTYFTLNPGGPSHSYFKRLFIDRAFSPQENPADYSFIPAKLSDNRALMEAQPEYEKSLKKLPPKLQRAWLEGSWDVLEGQYFEEFRSEKTENNLFTHVIPAFTPPESWPVYRSYDFGYSKPFSVGWWCTDQDGRLYRILELYGSTGVPNEGRCWSPREQMEAIAKLEREHPYLRGRDIQGVADPSIFDGSRGVSIASMGQELGVFFRPGTNKRLAGWMEVRNRLRFDARGVPGMYIFDTCKDFLRTFPLLRYDPQGGEDLDTRDEDHIADETRYMCMFRPLAATEGLPRARERIQVRGL